MYIHPAVCYIYIYVIQVLYEFQLMWQGKLDTAVWPMWRDRILQLGGREKKIELSPEENGKSHEVI